MGKRIVPAINGHLDYVEGAWMAAITDTPGPDNVYLVGPDERVRLIVEVKGATIAERAKLACDLANMLNRE